MYWLLLLRKSDRSRLVSGGFTTIVEKIDKIENFIVAANQLEIRDGCLI